MRSTLLAMVTAALVAACAGAPSPAATLNIPADTPPPGGNHEAWPLEHLLPMDPAGEPSSSRTGQNAIYEYDSNGWFIGAACRDPADFSGAQAGRASVVRVAGAQQSAMEGAFLEQSASWAETPLIERVSIGGRDVMSIKDGAQLTGYAYAVGELLFIIPADEHAQQTISDLPAPGTDTSALGAPVGPAPANCIGPSDPALLALLPTELGGQEMQRIRVTFYSLHAENIGTSASDFVALSGATKDNFIGYLLAGGLGFGLGAYRVAGADRATLERSCGPLVYWSGPMDSVVIDGKQAVVVPESGGSLQSNGCYVRGDVLFWAFGGLLREYLDALP